MTFIRLLDVGANERTMMAAKITEIDLLKWLIKGNHLTKTNIYRNKVFDIWAWPP